MRTIGFVLADGFQVMSLAALSVFELANASLGDAGYALHLHSAGGGPVRSSLGFGVDTRAFGPDSPDTIIVTGALVPDPAPAGVLDYLRDTGRGARRIAGICTGAFVLAEAGLLDGRRATTHWAHAAALQQHYPAIRVEADRIFCADQGVWTSAGMSAGIDLALALLEDDHGPALAKSVAHKLVVYHRRAGGQSQFSTLVELAPKSDRIRQALAWAREHLAEPLTVETLAAAVHLSPRQFSRVFREETGQSPAKAVERLRIEAARAMIEDGRHGLAVVARETGFGDRERLRRAFLRGYGQPPQALRRRNRDAQPA